MRATTERSLGALVRDIGGNVDRLARAELGLARANLQLRAEAIGEASVRYVAAAAAATIAAVFVLLSVMFALARVMPPWLAALATAVVPGTAAVVLYVRGRSRHAWNAPPSTHHAPAGMKGDA